MTNNQLTREKVQWLHDAAEEAAAVGIKLTMNPSELLMFTSELLATMDSEPVAYMYRDNLHSVARFSLESKIGNWSPEDINEYEISETPLYRHAQPAPVDIPEMLTPVQASRAYCGEVRGYRDGWNACRAAMLQSGTLTSEDTKQAEPVTTANKLGNSPVIPDGYVMVPKEPTGKQWAAGVQAFDSGMDKVTRIYKAMLAAARQSPGSEPATVPDTWVPVSERLPEEGGRYWCYVEEQNSLGKSHYQWNCSWNGEIWGGAMMYGRVTHGMPLPAAPQEVKGES